MRSSKSYVKETLAFVNKLRKQAGAEPLDDLRTGIQNGHSCPVSTSLVDAFPGSYAYTSGSDDEDDPIPSYVYCGPPMQRRKFRQTRAVRRFVHAFDTGRLPEYHI